MFVDLAMEHCWLLVLWNVFFLELCGTADARTEDDPVLYKETIPVIMRLIGSWYWSYCCRLRLLCCFSLRLPAGMSAILLAASTILSSISSSFKSVSTDSSDKSNELTPLSGRTPGPVLARTIGAPDIPDTTHNIIIHYYEHAPLESSYVKERCLHLT